jgi:hypothetical protein
MTGHCPSHIHDWIFAPFTRFIESDKGLVGCAGLSLSEIMFVEHLRDYLQPRSIMVVGNSLGWSTIALALTFPEAQIVALDPDENGINLTKRLAEEHGLNIKPMVACSPDGLAPCAAELPGPVDLFLIDALHTNEAIVTDLTAAVKVASPDAFYLLHDVVNFRMVDGVRQIQKTHGLNAELLTRTDSGMGVIYRDVSPELAAYIRCFTDNRDLLAAYRGVIKQYLDEETSGGFRVGDVLGESLASLGA